jgi:hypothetical protein
MQQKTAMGIPAENLDEPANSILTVAGSSRNGKFQPQYMASYPINWYYLCCKFPP